MCQQDTRKTVFKTRPEIQKRSVGILSKQSLTPLNSHDLNWGKCLQSPKVSLEGIQVLTISIRTHVRHIEHQKGYNSGWNVLHINSCVIQMFHFKLFR